jgi:type I restriction enzyme S subunit
MKDTPFTADRLLALYDRVAEAEDAIPRLRRFVLDLAVRGKLVEQDPSDEPAAELLKRIAKEKARLVKAKAIRGQNATVAIADTELPCVLPRNNWAWVRLNDLGRLSGGMTPSMNRQDYWGGEVIWLSPKDIKTDEVSTSELKITELGLAETRLEAYPEGSLFIVARSGILKRTLPVAINRRPAASNQDLKVLVPFLQGMERYLQTMLRGFESFILKELVKTGTTVQSLKYDEFEVQPFPLPPLAEQQRIVAKVEELMALCDRLEAARAGREAVRDRLTAATWARLTAPETDAETFPTNARAALQTLPTLSTRPDQIKTLRQTILNLAVRGKLVAQDPTDEPAAELLKQIAKDKARLVKAGEITQFKGFDLPLEGDLVFAIPSHWQSVFIATILNELQTGPFGSSLHQSDYRLGGTPVINPASIQNERIVPIDKMAVDDKTLERLASFKLKSGDIVMARRGEMGRCAIVTEGESGWLCGTGSLILRPSTLIYARFLVLVIGSPFGREYLGSSSVGATMQNLNQSILLNLPFGLPPLAEQHRIVAKVDALMALCDQLEASLATATTTRSRLLEALLHEALGHKLEAA